MATIESLTPVHYALDGAIPLCGEESPDAEVTVLPGMVTRSDTCLVIVADVTAGFKASQNRCLKIEPPR